MEEHRDTTAGFFLFRWLDQMEGWDWTFRLLNRPPPPPQLAAAGYAVAAAHRFSFVS